MTLEKIISDRSSLFHIIINSLPRLNKSIRLRTLKCEPKGFSTFKNYELYKRF